MLGIPTEGVEKLPEHVARAAHGQIFSGPLGSLSAAQVKERAHAMGIPTEGVKLKLLQQHVARAEQRHPQAQSAALATIATAADFVAAPARPPPSTMGALPVPPSKDAGKDSARDELRAWLEREALDTFYEAVFNYGL